MKFTYTINEACDAIGVGRSKIYQLIQSGEITPRKLGKRTLIPSEELLKLISNLPTSKREI